MPPTSIVGLDTAKNVFQISGLANFFTPPPYTLGWARSLYGTDN